MKRSTKTLLIISIIIAALLLSACGQSQSTTATTSAQPSGSDSGNQAAANDQNAIYGNVTAINGNVITLAIGTLNQTARPSGQRSPGAAPSGSRPQYSGNPNASGQPSGGQRPSMLTLTGETKTITITDESIITAPSFNRQNNGQNGQQGAAPGNQGPAQSGQPQISSQKVGLSAIQVGSTLRIIYASDNTTIQSIMIMNGFGRGNQGGQNGGDASAPPSSTAAAS